jgi:hypothetical protein
LTKGIFTEICQGTQNLDDSSKNIKHPTSRPKQVLLLLKPSKCTLQSKYQTVKTARYKHHTHKPQYVNSNQQDAARPADSQLYSITSTIYHIYTFCLLMMAADTPKTCSGVITEYTADKQCTVLVIIHIIQDEQSTKHKEHATMLRYMYNVTL